MPFYLKRKLFLLCEYRDRHNTAFYYNDKLDIWYNSLYNKQERCHIKKIGKVTNLSFQGTH